MGSACTKPNENNGNQANKKKNSSGMPDAGYNKTKSYKTTTKDPAGSLEPNSDVYIASSMPEDNK